MNDTKNLLNTLRDISWLNLNFYTGYNWFSEVKFVSEILTRLSVVWFEILNKNFIMRKNYVQHSVSTHILHNGNSQGHKLIHVLKLTSQPQYILVDTSCSIRTSGNLLYSKWLERLQVYEDFRYMYGNVIETDKECKQIKNL